MSQKNVEMVRRANELYLKGDWDVAIQQFVDPDVEWETRWPGLPPVYHGRAGVKQWAAHAVEPMQIEMKLIEAREVDEERVFAAYRVRGQGRGSGVPTEMKVFDLLSIRDGMIYRRQTFYTEEEALEAGELSE